MKVQRLKLVIASLVLVFLGFVSTAKADNQYTTPFFIQSGDVFVCAAMNVSKTPITVKITIIKTEDGTIVATQENTVQPMTHSLVGFASSGEYYSCKFTTPEAVT